MTPSVDSSVGVLGAGGSGLLAAAALRRAGVDFEALEARGGVGGTWRYDQNGTGSACYASLVANTSKLRMSLHGRRIPGRPWHYAGHAQMLAYLERFADEEDLRRSIRLNWRVADARESEGGWTVVSSDGEERRYSALVSAIPTSGQPRFAQVPGTYSGEQLHSAAYRKPEPFAGKDVLVLGLGTSGAEVAGELAGVARSVRVSVRSPLWMMKRRIAGIPLDWLDNPTLGRMLPWSARRPVFAALCKATTGTLHKHGLPRTTRRCGDDIIAISDTFPRAVRRGLVEFRPALSSASGREVEFVDGSKARVDVIVHATGYDPASDFLPEHAQPAPQKLYRGVLHTEAPNLFFVGLVEAHRALLPIVEDQAGWAADVIAGRLPVPPRDEQRRAAARFAERRRRDFGDRHEYLVDHPRYRAVLKRDRRSRNGAVRAAEPARA